MPPENPRETILAQGEYSYELRRGRELVAVEEETFTSGMIRGVRRTADGLNRHEVRANLDANNLITAVTVRYSRGPFSRNASYDAVEGVIRGHLSAIGGRETLSAKLGRMGEVDADLILCKALIIAHVRGRRQALWIGRVATVDPNTLLVASYKQTYRRRDEEGRQWIFEPRMGDAEELEVDEDGKVLRLRSLDGTETTLRSFAPATGG